MKHWLLALLLAGCSVSPPPPETPVAVETPTPVPIGAPTGQPQIPQTEAGPPRKLDVPIYPGARALGGGQLKLKGEEAFLATLDYQTADPLAKVVSFYRKKFPQAKLTRLQEPGYELVTLQHEKAQITVSRSSQGPTLVNLVRQR